MPIDMHTTGPRRETSARTAFWKPKSYTPNTFPPHAEHYQWENVKGEPIIHFDYSKLQVEHIMPQ
jgi:hypothetical protein